MIINKQGKLFGKISVIDILAIVAILVLIAGVYTRFIKTDETSVDTGTASSTFEYELEVSRVREGTVNALKEGGTVIDTSTKEEMGEIVSVVERPSYTVGVKADGTYAYTEVPERYDVTVTVRVDGKVSSDGYYTTQNKQLTAGSSYTFTSKLAQTSGEITAIREIE